MQTPRCSGARRRDLDSRASSPREARARGCLSRIRSRKRRDPSRHRSESDGSIALGDSRFDRINGRIQLAGTSSQTDFFAGYQKKFFGWPNLYTPFNSPAWENFGGRERFLREVPRLVPLGRIGSPEEAGALACFLLSDAAAYMTGHALVADGGERLPG